MKEQKIVKTVKEHKKLRTASPATYYVVAPSGTSKEERFENLKQQYQSMLAAQNEMLLESEMLVKAVYGEVACG